MNRQHCYRRCSRRHKPTQNKQQNNLGKSTIAQKETNVQIAKTQANALKAGQDMVFNHGNDWQSEQKKLLNIT